MVRDVLRMFPGASGSRSIPRKIAGREMITIVLYSRAMNMPRLVFDKATHLYRSDTGVIGPAPARSIRSSWHQGRSPGQKRGACRLKALGL
jgi:hypothetical protein